MTLAHVQVEKNINIVVGEVINIPLAPCLIKSQVDIVISSNHLP